MSRAAERRWRQSLDRWSAVLRYHRPQQLARRIWNRVRDKLPTGEASVAGPTPKVRDLFSRDAQQSAPLRVAAKQDIDALRAGKIRLLNREFALSWPPRWDDADREGLPLLAVFHLHYHEHLLRIVGEEPKSAWSAVSSWIERFSFPDRTPAGWAAWHPYCISRRVFAWLKLLRLDPPDDLRTAMINHLAKQARRLACRFELDIGGNHLWENARALAALGAFFEGDEAESWRAQGLSTLWLCTQEQLSPEGEHFERSPMYQAELAHGLNELAEVLDAVDAEAAMRCRATASRMSAFLDGLRHPDGGLPLLGDTTRDCDFIPSSLVGEGGERSEPGEGCRKAEALPLTPIPSPTRGEGNSVVVRSHGSWHGDYFIDRSEHGFLLFDAGDVGPDHLPAHAHSDLLGFEASAFGQRLFVDSGVFSYQGPRREEFRKAAAHNVLTVNGAELADVWGSFRVGRRGHVVSRQSGRQDGVHWIMAEHDAYRRMGVRIQRWWLIAEDGQFWISAHVVLGRGSELLTERLHFHPEIDWTQNGRSITLKTRNGKARWIAASPTEIRTETTAYSERFHEEQSKTTLVMERRSELPAVSAWGLQLGDGDFEASARIEANRLVVDWKSDGADRVFERSVDD